MNNNVQNYYRPVVRLRDTEEFSTGRRWTMILATPIVWFMPAVVFMVIVGILLGLFIIPLGFVAGPIASVLVLYSINRIRRAQSRQRAQLAIGYLENAARLNLPLSPFLLAAEQSETGATARELRVLRENLARGFSVSASLSGAIPGVSDASIAELSAAEQNGQLQAALARLVDEELRKIDLTHDESQVFWRYYPVGVGGTLFLLLVGFLILVVPKFQEIFKDFRTELPWMTRMVLEIGNFADQTLLSTILPILFIGLIITYVGYQLQRLFTPWWPVPSPRKGIETLAWCTPIWHQIQRDRGMAVACRVLAQGTRAGNSLPRALEQACAVPANAHFRRRLEHWKSLVIAGNPAAQAAQSAGLPAVLVGFLMGMESNSASSDNKGQAEMFEFLARYYSDRLSRTAVALRAAAEPAIVIVLGMAVGVFVIAMFLPLVKLIESVAVYGPGGSL